MARALSIQTHGGRCCGIKTIWNFPYEPSSTCEATSKKPFDKGIDYYGRGVRKDFDWFCDKAPREDAKSRLIRKIDYIKKKRPQHLIEVVLGKYQKQKWGTTIQELGFKLVTTFKNSNTGCTLYVYHLAYDTTEGN